MLRHTAAMLRCVALGLSAVPIVIGIARAWMLVPRTFAVTSTGPGRVPVVIVVETKPFMLAAVVGASDSPPFGPKRLKSMSVPSTAAPP